MGKYLTGSFYKNIENILPTKQDKENGKGLSQENFTTTLKTKLDNLPDSSDITTQINTAISNLVGSSPSTLDTLEEIATALGNDPNLATTITTAIGTKASQADHTALALRVTALETWKGVMPKKIKVYTGTTDSSGKLVISFASGEFSNSPVLNWFKVFNNENYSLVMNTLSVSTSGATVCFLREKNSSVLLGGNITPSEPYATQSVAVIAMEF